MNHIKSVLLSIGLAGAFLSALPADSQPNYFPTAYLYPTNAVKLQIGSFSSTNLNLLVNSTQFGVEYQLLSKQSLTDAAWTSEGILVGPANVTATSTNVSLLNRGNTLFLKVQYPQISGLALWLAADLMNGTNNTSVSLWPDQSGNSNNAVQNTSANRPLYLTNVINGRPALQFNGTSDQMLLPTVSATNDFTIFIVEQTSVGHHVDTEDINNTSAGRIQDGHQYIMFDNKVTENVANGGAGISVGTNGLSTYEYDFPSTGPDQIPPTAVFNGNVGAGAAVVETVYAARQPRLYLNGSLVRTGLSSARTNLLSPREIGGDSYGSFQGNIAEILIFNRALTDAERLTVEAYLNHKYAVAGILPNVPTGLFASAVSSNQVNLTWTIPITGATEFRIERKLGTGGTYQQIGTTAATTASYLDTGLSAATQYYYRIRSSNLTGNSDYSNETNATTTSTASLPLGNLKLWLEADAGVNQNSSSQVSQWNDQSGSGNNAVVSGTQPLYATNIVNGRPAIQFDGTNNNLLVPNVSGTNDFTIFLVAQTSLPHRIDTEGANGSAGIQQNGHQYLLFDNKAADSDTTSAGAGLSLGTNGFSAYEFEPPVSGPDQVPPMAVYTNYVGSAPVIISAIYAAKQPTLYVSGTLARVGLTTSKANVYAPREIGGDSYGYFQGNIAEVLIFNRALTDDERQTVETYLGGKYTLP